VALRRRFQQTRFYINNSLIYDHTSTFSFDEETGSFQVIGVAKSNANSRILADDVQIDQVETKSNLVEFMDAVKFNSSIFEGNEVLSSKYTLSNTHSNDFFALSNTFSNYSRLPNYWTMCNTYAFTGSNVGLGSVPTEQLEVQNNVKAGAVVMGAAGCYFGLGWKWTGSAWSNYTTQGGGIIRNEGNGKIAISVGSNSLPSPTMTFVAGGLVGIGTSNPNASYKLEVNGGVNATTLYEGSNAINTLYAPSNCMSNWNFGSNTAAWCSNNYGGLAVSNHTHPDKYVSSVSNNTIYTLSNVGIGTSNPNASLHIQGVNTSIVHSWSGGSLINSSPLQYVLRAENFDIYSTSNQHYGGIALRSYNTTGTGIYSDPVRAKIGLAFITRNGTSSNVEAMNIDNAGQVGIGFSNPNYKLDVNGTARATTLMEGSNTLVTKYALSNTYALTSHNHDTQYSFSNHNHDTQYSFSNHNHDTQYSFSNHTHADKLWTGYSTSNIITQSNVAIMATSESTNATLYICSPYNTDSPRKTAIIAAGQGGWSKASLNFCLEDSFGTSISSSATLSNARMTIQPNGCVGIGLTNPSYLLHVNTSNNSYGIAHTASNVKLTSYISTTSPNAPAQIGTATNHKLGFYTNDQSPHMVLDTAGNVGIGTATPWFTLDIAGTTRSSNAIHIQNGFAGLYLWGNGNSSYRWNISHDVGSEGDSCGNLNFYADSDGANSLTHIAYIEDDIGIGATKLNFTGSHRVVDESKKIDPEVDWGLIVVASGKYNSLLPELKKKQIDNITIDEALPTIELCSKRKDKRIFGVISKGDTTTKDKKRRVIHQGNFKSCMRKEDGDDRIEINSLGEGSVWLTDTNGNFENGDYITTSSVAGYGEKQSDDLIHNYTLGKVTTDVDWAASNLDKKFQTRVVGGHLCAFVGCIYML
jgi:hypothetical protein